MLFIYYIFFNVDMVSLEDLNSQQLNKKCKFLWKKSGKGKWNGWTCSKIGINLSLQTTFSLKRGEFICMLICSNIFLFLTCLKIGINLFFQTTFSSNRGELIWRTVIKFIFSLTICSKIMTNLCNLTKFSLKRGN